MPYEVKALETGWRLALHASDWNNLMGLAYQYGWRPEAGLDHYLHDGRRIVPSFDAGALAEALKEALLDLPSERRQEPRLPYVGDRSEEPPRPGTPDADPVSYFSWQRRWIVEEVGRLCRRGAVEIVPI